MKKDKDALETFLGQIDQKYKRGIEFRNKSWWKPEIYKLLETSNVALTWSENEYESKASRRTSDIAYLRMVGDRTITNFSAQEREQRQTMTQSNTAPEDNPS